MQNRTETGSASATTTTATPFSLTPPVPQKPNIFNGVSTFWWYAIGVSSLVILFAWIITAYRQTRAALNTSVEEKKAITDLLKPREFVIVSDLDGVQVVAVWYNYFDEKSQTFLKHSEKLDKTLRSRQSWTLFSERGNKKITGITAEVEVLDPMTMYSERFLICPAAGDSIFTLQFSRGFGDAYADKRNTKPIE
jgi:hypothetical protein